MKKVTLRQYEESDFVVTCLIHDKARPIELLGSCDEKAFIPLKEDQTDLESFYRSQKTVACINGQVVGFVGIDESVVTWLYVDPIQFGKGIGRLLLRKGLSHISTTAIVYLLDGNRRARNLYESEGFKLSEQFDSNNNGYPCSVLKLSK